MLTKKASDFVDKMLTVIIQIHLVEQSQMKALELFSVELHGQRGSIPREALQLLDEVPALGQRYTSPTPTHLDAGLWCKLLTDRGNQSVVLNF